MKVSTVMVLLVAALGVGFLAGQQQTQQSRRYPQFDNSAVKVWRTVVMPNLPIAMHRHDDPRIIVPRRSGKMKIVEQDGSSVTHDRETGRAYWLGSMKPGAMHADVNAGDQPREVMVVEMLREP